VPTLHAPRTSVVLLALCALLAIAGPRIARADETPSDVKTITVTDINDAIAKVKADPNLATERKIKSFRWRSNAENEQPTTPPSWLKWLGNFFGFLAQTSRVIVWLAIVVAVALLVVAILKIIRNIEPRSRAAAFVAPTHVRDLDIRPESLPDDIGAAALALWDRGEHRAALALLYRGLLSRLVHAHEIPVRHSSTEGDCLQLAAKHLQGARGDYVARLIRVWQRAVYGAQSPQTEDVQVLCSGFSAAVDKQPAASPTS
jgi:hypothetical protein